MAAKAPSIEVYKDKKGEHRWRLKSTNGSTIADSAEGYKTKRGVTDSVKTFQRSVPVALVVDCV